MLKTYIENKLNPPTESQSSHSTENKFLFTVDYENDLLQGGSTPSTAAMSSPLELKTHFAELANVEDYFAEIESKFNVASRTSLGWFSTEYLSCQNGFDPFDILDLYRNFLYLRSLRLQVDYSNDKEDKIVCDLIEDILAIILKQPFGEVLLKLSMIKDNCKQIWYVFYELADIIQSNPAYIYTSLLISFLFPCLPLFNGVKNESNKLFCRQSIVRIRKTINARFNTFFDALNFYATESNASNFIKEKKISDQVIIVKDKTLLISPFLLMNLIENQRKEGKFIKVTVIRENKINSGHILVNRANDKKKCDYK